MERVDCIVIGAGIIGLACARALAMTGREVIILERASDIGSETSSRNSEVIHAGIYYPSDSLKASLCLRGRQQLYQYCEERNIRHQRCGKLIVATSDTQLDTLRGLQAQAIRNGVDDVVMMAAADAMSLEPALYCEAALWSPQTGIIDSHGLMTSLLGDAENHGAVLVLNSPVTGGRREADAIELSVGGESPVTLLATTVVNAAGLWAQAVASSMQNLDKAVIPAAFLARGVYFSLRDPVPFRHLVYPLPEPGGLGCHFTLDLDGRGRFGPDVEWVDEVSYHVEPGRANAFYQSIRHYWPQIRTGSLQPDYAGIRPKISTDGEFGDFIIQDSAAHGMPGLVNLYGIESPGLTSSMAIAEAVLAAATVQK